MDIYTRTGDDGTTGLLFGGRVRKDALEPTAYGAVDEAQAAIGVARAHTEPGGELDELLVGIEGELWVLMAELATAEQNREKLVPGTSLVTPGMVEALERSIDQCQARYEPSREFVVPGSGLVSAHLDLARTVVRRAERDVVAVLVDGSHCLEYLNRLSDLLFVLARWQEDSPTAARDVARTDTPEV